MRFRQVEERGIVGGCYGMMIFSACWGAWKDRLDFRYRGALGQTFAVENLVNLDVLFDDRIENLGMRLHQQRHFFPALLGQSVHAFFSLVSFFVGLSQPHIQLLLSFWRPVGPLELLLLQLVHLHCQFLRAIDLVISKLKLLIEINKLIVPL